MKINHLLLSLITALVFFTACQKEVSYQTGSTPSAGSLQSSIAGDCLPKTVAGVYEEKKVLDPATNYIDVQVNVTKAGSYTIYTDTLNGTYFRAIGTFATAGVNTVRLAGNGTPANDGIYNYTVTYIASECVVPVTVLPTGGAVPAVLTLDGNPNACMNYLLAGNYTAGTAMTATNTVAINVNVTTAGTYTISTAVSNGISFAGAGVLANIGAQTITLTATGTPIAAGSTNFPITVGTSTCNFAVDVLAPAFDYFPRTAGSNWSYEYDNTQDDSLLVRVKAGTVALAGNQYNVFESTFDAAGGFGDAGNYRKSGGDYHTYADMGEYFQMDAAVNIDYIFLKDNVAAGSTWESGTITGTIGGLPVSVRVAFTIDQKDVAVTVNGEVYNNVIIVLEKYEVFDGVNWIDVTDQIGYFKSYYARNIGLIKQDYYQEDNNPNPPIFYQQDIRRHQVL
ncbi:MAG: hypothetical protein ABI675_01115 [Chitinophagaceae bacterium]